VSKEQKTKTSEYMRQLGRKGGTATAQKHGKEYMSQLGKKGFEALAKKQNSS